jgi:hypothetical protein
MSDELTVSKDAIVAMCRKIHPTEWNCARWEIGNSYRGSLFALRGDDKFYDDDGIVQRLLGWTIQFVEGDTFNLIGGRGTVVMRAQ